MVSYIKFVVLLLIVMSFTSCSAFLGGLVALDNAANKGPKIIKPEQIKDIHEGNKVIIELKDSTKVSGTFQKYENINKKNGSIKRVTIFDTDNKNISVNTSDINKFTFIDEGGNVWVAVAIGAAIDSFLIYMGIRHQKDGSGGIPILNGPL